MNSKRLQNETNLSPTACRIFAALELRARDSYTQIAKRTKLSEQLVKYHVHRGKDEGFVSEMTAIFDPTALGYTLYIVYLRFSGASSESERRWFKKTERCKGVMVLADTFERWNAIVAVFAKDANHLDRIINTLTRPMKDKVVEMQVTTRLRCHYGSTCILNKSYQVIKPAPATPPPIVRVDEKDLKIMHMLAIDARVSARRIGTYVELSPSTVQNRIAQLEAKKVIVGYRAIYDYSRLGYFVSRLLFRLAEPASTITNQITKELFRTGKVNVVARHLGFADLDARCLTRSINHLSSLISGIRDKFVDDILRVDIVPILRWQFVNHLPITEIEELY